MDDWWALALYSTKNKCPAKVNNSIALLLDNAGCHLEDLLGKYSNIKVVFMRQNNTSIPQPLDRGVINNFKVYYRKCLSQHVTAKVEECSNSSQSCQVCWWVAQAWESVLSETTKNCFRKGGIVDKDFRIVSRDVLEDDPFADLELERGLMNFK